MTPEPREVLRELDERERAILLAIYEHKVLLTEHVKAMFSRRFVAPRIACAIS
ncbi:MAG: hypothetical protein M3454_17250 [Actinomycetota bacterium]|nr:hypothetical protein [Actinomycetota bacterium]